MKMLQKAHSTVDSGMTFKGVVHSKFNVILNILSVVNTTGDDWQNSHPALFCTLK